MRTLSAGDVQVKPKTQTALGEVALPSLRTRVRFPPPPPFSPRFLSFPPPPPQATAAELRWVPPHILLKKSG